MDTYILPDYKKSAVVAVDTQWDVFNGSLSSTGDKRLVNNIVRVIDEYRRLSLPVIHIVRLYKKDGSNADLCRRKMIEEGISRFEPEGRGSFIVDGLLPDGIALDYNLLLSEGIQNIGSREVIIYKPRWSSFYNTPLDDYLRTVDVNTLSLVGCSYPNCIRATLFDASARDYKLVMAKDATHKLDARGIEEMSDIGVNILDTEEIIEALGNGTLC